MRRAGYLAYSIVCYLIFFGVFLYAIGFIGNILVPRSLDAEPTMSPLAAAGIDLLLLALFAVQHSVMARPTFKNWWTNYVPKPLERSTYVLFSNLAMILIFLFWQPIGGEIWNVTSVPGQVVLYSLFGLGDHILCHLFAEPLRTVWSSPGVPPLPRATLHAAVVQPTGAL